jgi:hypothetical protein
MPRERRPQTTQSAAQDNAVGMMAEGARFELADPLRGLRFSRPARSAAPSPLHALLILTTGAFLMDLGDRIAYL